MLAGLLAIIPSVSCVVCRRGQWRVNRDRRSVLAWPMNRPDGNGGIAITFRGRACRTFARAPPSSRTCPISRGPEINESPDVPPSVVIPGLDPIRAKIASRLERHGSMFVMVRLDRTIGVSKIALTRCARADGPVEPDHDEGGNVPCHIARGTILAPMGLDPGTNTSAMPRLIPGSSPGMTGDVSVVLSGAWYNARGPND